MGEVSGQFLILLNPILKSGDLIQEGGYQEIKEIAARMICFLRESYQMTVWLNMSQIRQERDGILNCYEEILKLRDYREVVGTNQEILCPSDLSSEEELCRVRMWRQEQQVKEFLYQHQYAAARSLIDQLAKEEERLEQEYDKKIEPQKVGSHVVEEVIAYIEQHYTDKQLSASLLSDLFGLSLSNLSQSFKRKTEMGVTEYISQRRMAAAKKLLETGMTVKDTAEQVGYYNTRPLIRLFRELEGVTPSEYREMNLASKKT